MGGELDNTMNEKVVRTFLAAAKDVANIKGRDFEMVRAFIEIEHPYRAAVPVVGKDGALTERVVVEVDESQLLAMLGSVDDEIAQRKRHVGMRTVRVGIPRDETLHVLACDRVVVAQTLHSARTTDLYQDQRCCRVDAKDIRARAQCGRIAGLVQRRLRRLVNLRHGLRAGCEPGERDNRDASCRDPIHTGQALCRN